MPFEEPTVEKKIQHFYPINCYIISNASPLFLGILERALRGFLKVGVGSLLCMARNGNNSNKQGAPDATKGQKMSAKCAQVHRNCNFKIPSEFPWLPF